MGGWKRIGYIAPGAKNAGDEGKTTNFTYNSEGLLNGSAAITANAKTSDAWKATSNVPLNDCLKDQKWNVDVIGASNGNSLTYEAHTQCPELTPSFSKIGK